MLYHFFHNYGKLGISCVILHRLSSMSSLYNCIPNKCLMRKTLFKNQYIYLFNIKLTHMLTLPFFFFNNIYKDSSNYPWCKLFNVYGQRLCHIYFWVNSNMFHNIYRYLKIAKNLKRNGEEVDFLSFHFNRKSMTHIPIISIKIRI